MKNNFKDWWSSCLHLHVLPILVWLGAVAWVVVLFHHRTQRFEVLGTAQHHARQDKFQAWDTSAQAQRKYKQALDELKKGEHSYDFPSLLPKTAAAVAFELETKDKMKEPQAATSVANITSDDRTH